MSYANEYLRNFRPVFLGIVKAKGICPKRLVVEIIDEESERYSIFEPVDVRDVLEQIADDINTLIIYTQRAAYFTEFAETMYEENGLIVRFLAKNELCAEHVQTMWMKQNQAQEVSRLVLDFEWEGNCHMSCMRPHRYYVPIHKKRWLPVDNLDIMIPFGYNTLIVRDIDKREKTLIRDRFEAEFYFDPRLG